MLGIEVLYIRLWPVSVHSTCMAYSEVGVLHVRPLSISVHTTCMACLEVSSCLSGFYLSGSPRLSSDNTNTPTFHSTIQQHFSNCFSFHTVVQAVRSLIARNRHIAGKILYGSILIVVGLASVIVSLSAPEHHESRGHS